MNKLTIHIFIISTILLFGVTNASAWTFCAKEGEKCNFSGTKQVRYGENGKFVYKIIKNGTNCTNQVFGDPIYGTVKQCYTKDLRNCPINKSFHVRDYCAETPTNPNCCVCPKGSKWSNVSAAYRQCKQVANASRANKWVKCAMESELCTVPANVFVKYCSSKDITKCARRDFSRVKSETKIPCNFGTFHKDPHPGVRKVCYYQKR